jgi:hypothetical protein
MMEMEKKSRATWKLEVKRDGSATSIATSHTQICGPFGFGFYLWSPAKYILTGIGTM